MDFDTIKGIITFWIMPLLIIAIVAVIANFLRTSRKRQPGNQSFKYEKIPALLTNNELAFYKALIPIATKNGYIVFSKVRIADLITPQKGASNWQAAFNKISSKHIDFILCDRISTKPVLAIELDDSSHDRPDRQQRDSFVDSAMKSAGLPILHTRDINNLSNKIESAIQGKKIKAGV